MPKAFLICFVFIAALATSGYGQTANPTIEVGAVRLQLGTPESDGLASLRKATYFVHKQDNSESWFVFVTDQRPSDPIASVGFLAGKLDNVYKYWGPPDQEQGVSLAAALYNAISAITAGAPQQRVVRNDESINQLAEIRTTFIGCGGKRIEISRVKCEKTEQATVTEIIKAR